MSEAIIFHCDVEICGSKIKKGKFVRQKEWVGLTDEEIDGLWKMAQMFRAHKHFYLLVEAKLKEKNT